MKKILLSVATIASISMAGGDILPSTTTSSHDGVIVETKAGLLKFSGEHRLAYYYNSDDDHGEFKVDRTYLQVKAYFFDDPKSYARITLDVKDEDGTYETYLKYSYLYLNNILPHTGVEIGQVHKPWVDYEEHYGFKQQAVYGVYADKFHITSSADRGLNFKTKLDNFSSEIGVFQGEGYKNTPDNANDGVSFDARFTYHVFGTHNKKEYFNISLAGAMNQNHNEIVPGTDGDLHWGLIHAVYKNSDFLVAGQYIDVFKNQTDRTVDDKGTGYSFNADYYVTDKITIFGRYDEFERDRDDDEKENIIGGVTYKYNKYVTFALSAINKSHNDDDSTTTQALVWVKW
jgi:hypothetical protein